ncbi:hypothetical protein PoB_007017200 [Plakobranchus ocellatus]|uniref:Secreted peptide n=1 Tax=Plakobranchus ocellatus TaxID=259542 RepID=A0AAV4DHE8_9GAST|nr:hypothetical protein PoB_007017200 [Plakobranchus ocellatus]
MLDPLAVMLTAILVMMVRITRWVYDAGYVGCDTIAILVMMVRITGRVYDAGYVGCDTLAILVMMVRITRGVFFMLFVCACDDWRDRRLKEVGQVDDWAQRCHKRCVYV